MARPKTKILDLNSALLQPGKTATGTQPFSPRGGGDPRQ